MQGVKSAARSTSPVKSQKPSASKPAKAEPKAQGQAKAKGKSGLPQRPAPACDAFDTSTKPASPGRSYHVTPEKLVQIEPKLSLESAKKMAPNMNAAFDEFKLDTPRKVSAFL